MAITVRRSQAVLCAMAFLSLAMARKGSARKYQDGPPSRAATASRRVGIPTSPVWQGVGIIAAWFAPNCSLLHYCGRLARRVGFCTCTVDSARPASRSHMNRGTFASASIRATHARAKKSGPLSPVCPNRPRWGAALPALADARATTPGGAPPKHGARGCCRWRGGTGLANFCLPDGQDHGAQRSGPCPGNEVFALLNKTGTRRCLVVVHRPPGFNRLRHWVRLARL